jgi:hypothetical protein
MLPAKNCVLLNVFVFPEIDDHSGRRGNVLQIPTQWWYLLASTDALDMKHWEMHTISHWRTARMVITMTNKVGAFFDVLDFILVLSQSKQPCYGQCKSKQS